jgi:DNA-binding CsgD family transcriptional regulator
MEGGRIVERGTHEELLALHGRYHELIASQREAVSEGGPQARQRPAELDGLTKREHQILRLVANGLSDKEIADSLVISPITAKTHVSRILKKLDCHDRAQLMTLAHETGTVTRSMGRVGSYPSNDAGKTFTIGSNDNDEDFPATKGRDISGERGGDVHVVPSDNGWRVDVEGRGRASGTYNTQHAAWQQAKQIAQRNQSEALLHGRNGQIRERKIYRYDPR